MGLSAVDLIWGDDIEAFVDENQDTIGKRLIESSQEAFDRSW